MSNDEFLATCETLWRLSDEEKALQTRATEAKNAGDEGALNETTDRIDLNLWKRQFFLLRARDMAFGLA
jgi:hypothetical protein